MTRRTHTHARMRAWTGTRTHAHMPAYTHARAHRYTWFNVEALQRFWQSLDAVVADRKDDLDREQARQEGNERLRLLFARQANDFAKFLASTRAKVRFYLFVGLVFHCWNQKKHSCRPTCSYV